ncbi:hypothetical protein Sste5346_004156 [Sporothrix stenoceras]|uniref:C2H2-type domain-containing protein n=1 Tax=Sporothrix stenoceras TaxID=5173 RepID=A0ABR3ZBL6_9PEZI
MAGLRVLLCTYCSQTFSKQEHLARHVRSHTHEKPFACRICGKAFGRNDTLLRHARGHRSTTTTTTSDQRPQEKSIDAMDQDTDASSNLNLLNNSAGKSASRDPQVGLPLMATGADINTPQTAAAAATATATATAPYISPANLNLDPKLDPRLQDSSNGHTNSPNFNFQTPTWQTSVDFELDAFHRFMLDTSLGWPLNGSLNGPLDGSLSDSLSAPLSDLDWSQMGVDVPPRAPAPPPQTVPHRQDAVQKHWFISRPPRRRPPGNVAQGVRKDGANKLNVDETYRASLSQKLLLQRIPHEALPSADFLNTCIQMYFTRFNPIFPLIHAHTFRPSAENSLLLLSICSIGSLFVGSPFAAEHGQKIYERVNKAILSSWETVLSSDNKLEAISLTQAGVISQTFGLLSGRPNDLLLAQGLHGTVITWARQCGIFRVLSIEDECGVPPDDVYANWRCWAKKEEQHRAATALFVLDAEHAALFKTEPLMRHSASRLPPLCTDNLWASSTAGEWNKLAPNKYAVQDALPRHPFSVYCELEGITASISEARVLGTLGDTLQQQQSLLQFHHQYLRHKASAVEPFCTEVLWHLAWMTLLADMDDLEVAAGREGHMRAVDSPAAQRNRAWAQSQNAARCAVHAALILRKAEQMQIGTEPAVHVPRALFYAALVWYCYIEFGQDDGDKNEGAARLPNFAEFEQLGVSGPQVLFEAHGFKNTRPTRLQSTVTIGLQGLLSRIGHWGISRTFASSITYMVYGDVQGDYESIVNSPERGG